MLPISVPSRVGAKAPWLGFMTGGGGNSHPRSPRTPVRRLVKDKIISSEGNGRIVWMVDSHTRNPDRVFG